MWSDVLGVQVSDAFLGNFGDFVQGSLVFIRGARLNEYWDKGRPQ